MLIYKLTDIPNDFNIINSLLTRNEPIIIKYLSTFLINKDIDDFNDYETYHSEKLYYYLIGYFSTMNQILIKDLNITIDLNNYSDIYFIDYLYPFYGGKYYNKFTIEYFNNLFIMNFKIFNENFQDIPSDINYILGNKTNQEYFKKKIDNIHQLVKNKLSLKDFIKLLSIKLNHNTIQDIYNKFDIPISFINHFKNTLINNTFDFNIDFNLSILKIIGYIFSNNLYNFKIFDYNSYILNYTDIIFNNNFILDHLSHKDLYNFKPFFITPNNKLYKIKKIK